MAFDFEKTLDNIYKKDNVTHIDISSKICIYKIRDNTHDNIDNIQIVYIQKKTEAKLNSSSQLHGQIFKDSTQKINKEIDENNKLFFFVTLHDKDNNPIIPERYIAAIELLKFPLERKDYTFSFKEDIQSFANNENRDFIRRKKADYHIVYIKVEDSNGNSTNNLKNYLTVSDSRTYKKIIYTNFVYKVGDTTVPEKQKDGMPHNLIVSGAPGTGKSYYLNEKVKEAGEKIIEDYANEMKNNGQIITDDNGKEIGEAAEKNFFNKYVSRVTFYEDYSYENFIGCYKPVPGDTTSQLEFDSKSGTIVENRITYEYRPGPFINMYVKAWNAIYDNNNSAEDVDNFFIIIEEINRAKAASVFGDIFQLLDRKNGYSDYEIEPDEALKTYLKTELRDRTHADKMTLPPNLYIWATMNSADQGVYPIDSAFKRRWNSRYMDYEKPRVVNVEINLGGSDGTMPWDSFRGAVNNRIIAAGMDEDKCIGPYYFTDDEIAQIDEFYSEENKEDLPNPLADKLAVYLRNDVFRMMPDAIFRKDILSVSRIFKNINKQGILSVFEENLAKEIKEEIKAGKTAENDSQNQES